MKFPHRNHCFANRYGDHEKPMSSEKTVMLGNCLARHYYMSFSSLNLYEAVALSSVFQKREPFSCFQAWVFLSHLPFSPKHLSGWVGCLLDSGFRCENVEEASHGGGRSSGGGTLLADSSSEGM